MGEKTQQALRDFQKSKNLKATGRLDNETANALGVSVKDSGRR
jgi:peptidoglycan hydrolase-like protein with peptidoglycan-binding domain